MENRQPLLLQKRILNSKPLTIKSLDFPELDGSVLLSKYSSDLCFVFPTRLKLKEDEYEDSKGNPYISFMLVDKDY
jgi:hypothetical protein